MTAVTEEKRRRLIKHVEARMVRAQDQGIWLGAIPVGFERDVDGYLQVVLDTDREAGDVSNPDVWRAIERVDGSES